MPPPCRLPCRTPQHPPSPSSRSALHHQWSKPALGLTMRQISLRGGMPTDKRIISISGDGGFLFCAQELETAV